MNDAIVSFDGGDKESGVKILESILKKEPNNEEVKNRLATFYYQLGEEEKFIEFVNDNNLKSATIYNMLATIYQSRGELNMAEENFQLAIEASPKSPQIYINYAAYYQSQSKFDKALEIIERGLTHTPGSITMLNSAASISLKMGDKSQSQEYANAVLRLDPNNSQAKAILAETI
ncbi:MAG: photosystem I assembly protein Ycf3 [bacterium ADurb.Bin212]|jgi:Tfp pilus assembly protein PilF|nr:MAG: photosystem I assembly protein Ycf3 [bacterium ADurb.Bin212]